MTASHAFENAMASIAARLQPCGFVRSGLLLRKIAGGNALVIELQKSDKSSSDRIIFTINLGLVYGELLEGGLRNLVKAEALDSHLNVRLGRLLQEPSDKWWEVNESTDVDRLAMDLSDALIRKAIPYLETYFSADALVALWESGKSPGLTAVQRARYLHRLKNSHEVLGKP